MLNHILPEQVLFIDIETVSQKKDFASLSAAEKDLWSKKAQALKKGENEGPEDIYPRAAIYAEFGKIICIGLGVLKTKETEKTLHIKCIKGENERELLTAFIEILRQHKNKYPYLCAHNGKEFDFPYIARRILINGLNLPDSLDLAGKKPWEVSLLDTMELWKFGDFKSYTSLELLAHVFGIPTPKDDIDGSQVYRVYWQENNLERISDYCAKDIITLARLFIKMKGLSDDLKIEIAA